MKNINDQLIFSETLYHNNPILKHYCDDLFQIYLIKKDRTFNETRRVATSSNKLYISLYFSTVFYLFLSIKY